MYKEISILGCGWLGEPLAIKLIESGHKIKGSTTSIHKMERLTSHGINVFLLDLSKIDESISKFLESELLIVNIPSKNIDNFKELILHLENSRIKCVLFISSTSVYEDSNEIVTEASALKNIALVKIENLFKHNRHFKTTIIRFAGLFGYNRKPGNFFPAGRKIPNPNGYVNMIHRDDCIEIINSIIDKELWGEIYNACADTHPTRLNFYTKAAVALGKNKPSFEQADQSSFKIISNDKLKIQLDYQFIYGDILKEINKI